MPIIDSPQLQLMPSFIEGLKNGYRLDNLDPRTNEEISEIENNSTVFFEEFVQRKTKLIISLIKPETPPIQRSEFWCADGNTYIGRVNIRHALNEELLTSAGNIGFEVVPKYQKQGYAAIMLDFGLDFFRQNTDLTKVLLITDDTNTQCINFIEKHRGILENKFQKPDNTIARRYWITL